MKKIGITFAFIAASFAVVGCSANLGNTSSFAINDNASSRNISVSSSSENYRYSAWTIVSRATPSSKGLRQRYCYDTDTIEYITTEYKELTSQDVLKISGAKNPASIKNFVIPEEYSVVADNAFTGCLNLKNVSFSDNIQSVGFNAFGDCKNLESVSISSIETWCAIDFSNDLSSTSNPLSIASHLYMNGKEIKNLVIPDSVTSIESYAFEGAAFDTVILGKDLYSIGASSFKNCSNLITVEIPESVSSIGKDAFAECTNLKSVVIRGSLSDSEENIFTGCNNLTSIIVKENTSVQIETKAFDSDNSITVIRVPSDIDLRDSVIFSDYVAKTSFQMPQYQYNDTKASHVIDAETFSSIIPLTKVNISTNVSQMSFYAYIGYSDSLDFELGEHKSILDDIHCQDDLAIPENESLNSFIAYNDDRYYFFDRLLFSC